MLHAAYKSTTFQWGPLRVDPLLPDHFSKSFETRDPVGLGAEPYNIRAKGKCTGLMQVVIWLAALHAVRSG